MSDVKTMSAQGPRPETKAPIALLDCGQASKVTKGMPWWPFYEGGWPPFDRNLG